MAQKWLPASSLTGGGEGALDAIDGSNVSDGDRAIVISDLVYFYVLDADSGLSESSPGVISPDSNAGNKRWVLSAVYPDTVEIPNLVVDADGPYVAFGGGSMNAIGPTGSMGGSGMFGGWNLTLNTSEGGIYDSYIIGGWDNVLEKDINDSAIVAGFGNKIFDYVYNSAIVGGSENKIENSCYQSSILGGQKNLVLKDVNDSVIFGGSENTMRNSIERGYVFGDDNIIGDDAHNCVAIGRGNRILPYWETVYGAWACGKNAWAIYDNQKAFAAGMFNYQGDAQESKFVLRKETTSATESNLIFGEGNNGFIPVKDPKSYKFDISVAARQVGGTAGTIGDSAFWNISGGIKNVGAAMAQGTITISGGVIDGDYVRFGNNLIYFKDDLVAWGDWNAALTTGTPSVALGSLQSIFLKHLPAIKAEVSGSDLVLTALPGLGIDANDWTFKSAGANISTDGGVEEKFGNTTSGSNGTVSIVGTPSGIGVPDTNQRDAGAAAWEVDVVSDDTNKGLKINVSGEADKTIHWVAKVNLVEVG